MIAIRCLLLPWEMPAWLRTHKVLAQVALGQMVNVVYFTAMCAFVFGLIGTAEFGGSYQRQCVLPIGKIHSVVCYTRLAKKKTA